MSFAAARATGRLRSAGARGTCLITGGSGNLGTKLATALAGQGTRVRILDPQTGPIESPLVAYHRADLDAPAVSPPCAACPPPPTPRPPQTEWRSAFDSVDAVVHLAAQNPYPEATWEDSAASMRITAAVFQAAVDSGVRRVVNASSNHVMGGYLARDRGVPLTPDAPLLAGTVWQGAEWMDATPYAAAKVAGEAMATAHAAVAAGTSFISIRVGWCQPGDNSPATISAAGTHSMDGVSCDDTPADVAGDPQRDPVLVEAWYRQMWLSNRDFVQLFTRAVHAPSAGPRGHAIVNGMSANEGSRWDLQPTRELLGYVPQDGV